MRLGTIIAIFLAALFAAAQPGPSLAGQGEQDRALELRRNSNLIPYGVIVRQVEQRFGGRVVGQRIVEAGDRVAYELRLLRDNGRVVVVVIDAKTGQVIRAPGG